MSGLWPLAPALIALDLSISPHCLWSSWGLSVFWPLTPWWPVRTSTTGLWPASWPLRTLIKQYIKPLPKGTKTVLISQHTSIKKKEPNTCFQCRTWNKWIECGSLADENHTSVTIFYETVWVFQLLPGSTATDFTNWFPFILRGELITKISRCNVGMDGEAAASSLKPNDWNLCSFVSNIYLRLYLHPRSLLLLGHIFSKDFLFYFLFSFHASCSGVRLAVTLIFIFYFTFTFNFF